MRWAAGAILLVVLAPTLQAAEYVWLEGENPSAKNWDARAAGWGNKHFLSQQAWLHINIDAAEVEARCPKDGILLSYDFNIASAGRHEIWNRVGFEFVRSPFDWRIDAAEWRTIRPEDLTCDLMEIDFWCEVAWLKMGEADLDAGKHTLQIRLTPTYKEENGKRVPNNILYCSDALCIHKGTFRPNGPHKPDADWQTEEDERAAAQVYLMRADAPPGERIETPLSGLWQVCRYDEDGPEVEDRDGPTKTLPDPTQAFWMAIQVPGNKFEVKPELRFCHRFVYRTRVDIPAALAGRSFFLRLPSVCLMASVFVNGQFCGFTKAPYALFDCDVTQAVRPGQINEIAVVVKDSYYAFSPKKSGKPTRLMFNIPVSLMGTQNWVNQHFDFPIGAPDYASQSGILEPPSLVAAGPVYVRDVFIMPSVKKKLLGLEITLLNPSAEERQVQVVNEAVAAGGEKPEKTFPAHDVTLAPGEERTVIFEEPWSDPKLWWPDEPNLYTLVTTVRLNGHPADILRTTFGFREWDWSGRQFRINGVPWQFWADTTYLHGDSDPLRAIEFWRQSGQNMWRFWGRKFGGLRPAEALDLMDRMGIVVRRSGIFDGQMANYLHQLANGRELFDNWITQLKAQVREERNHPAILIWSIENEITFINSRNLGLSAAVEPHIARAAREVMALDPTRPVMVDGGNCLMDNSLPVNGVHYQESAWRDYPEEAYTLARAYAAHEKPLVGWGKVPWQLVPDRPIFMGECFYARGETPGAYSQLGGEGCFQGWGEYTRVGVGRLAKMLAEGYRWHGVAAYHFWLSANETDLHYNSWKPVCVLCRQWNWTFGGASKVPRTLKVFNNTHLAGPIEVVWALVLEGKVAAREAKTFPLPPGGTQEWQITLPVPQVKKRTTGEFILVCRRGGKEVFRETKPVAVIDEEAGPRPKLTAGELVVVDPAGTAAARLKARGIAFRQVGRVDEIPATAKVVLVGRDALSPREATDPRWLALAAAGAKILVLEQANPLHHLALPADLAPTDFVGRIAFAENLQHPAFEGLDQQDFFTWSGDEVVYRNPYKKATRGAVSLVQCDQNLAYTALAECPVNDGLIVLCQLVVGEKLATDPVAKRLFDNLLAYCATYKPIRRTTAVVMDENSPAYRLLADCGLQFDRAPDPIAAITSGKYEIIIFDATPANLARLAGAASAIKTFTDAGGWLFAWGLTPDGLPYFNKLVGVEHLLRPFELERVTLPPVRDPLLSGITVRDVTMESAEKIFPWAGDKYLVDDEFTYIVDLDDIAPFCEFPGARAGDHAGARAAAAGWSRNTVNGFTSADAWKLIYYMSTAYPKLTLTFPRPEEVRRFSIVLNTHYCVPTKVNLYFDDAPTPVTLATKPTAERQDFDLTPRKVTATLTIELADFDKPGQTTGIDNLWIYVTRPPDWRSKVTPLLNIGGLVKYNMGKGGLVLCQLNVKDAEPVSENAQKKRAIVTALLRNLHATFAGGRLLTTANMKFFPIPLEERCNQYLTKDRGWYEDERDLSHLPQGDVTLGGVRYVIRDFKTSPLPSCIMLAGPGARGSLPTEVRGLPVGQRADALFFLHVFNRAAEWRPSKPDDQPPVLFAYIVHYADGQTAQVPIRYGEGVEHWIQREPTGLKHASVAWAAPFPGDASGDRAVVYQMQWNNQRPEVEIAAVDIVYGPDGSRWGTPALLAITAATEAR